MPTVYDSRPLSERARAYGCTRLIRLDAGLTQPEQLEYLDLLPRKGGPALPMPVSAVAEHQGTALLYLIDTPGHQPVSTEARMSLQRVLANRSDPAWLGLMRPGSLELWPIRFSDEKNQPLEVVPADEARSPLFFQSLVHGTFKAQPEGTDYVYQQIFKLLETTIDAFVPKATKGPVADGALEPLDVLSMAGRALFFRFLIDRRIVLLGEIVDICPAADDLKDAFSSAEKAALTSAWLDDTFNGDFLRLIDETIPPEERDARTRAYRRFYQDIHQRTGGRVFRHLEAILRGWNHVERGSFQLELDWGDLDFAHIPIGVLSQVYERFSHRADPQIARNTSVHYTPRTIARLLVEETFAAVENPADARVLDPACGAGIFLALSFRRLVRERWLRDKERPTVHVIKQILYNQLRGFDVSESALRLTALTLYITAIELNGSPRPPRSLKFPRNLRDEVLFHFGDESPSRSAFPLGSLGPRVPLRFAKHFDIVLGNPPWTRLRKEEAQRNKKTDELNEVFTEIGKRALRAHGLDSLARGYKNPDKNPDLPFLFRATEWVKDNGLIAMVLPARIFQRRGNGAKAWNALVRTISLTGLINGADLRKTALWEEMDLPFCLLFARNTRPPEGHLFRYAVPSFERKLNETGRFRIDYSTAQPLSIEHMESQPWLLKTLMFGTWLDVEVMERLLRAFPKTLGKIWTTWDHRQQRTGKGYDLSPGLKQDPDEFLANLRVFERPEDGFAIRFEGLKTFFEHYGRTTAHMPRREELYQAPLVLVPQTPGEDPKRARAYISRAPLAFSQSFYGYSCAEHPEAETLAALLYLLPHSDLFTYFCLMTSIRLGFDRQTFNKEDLDAIPFPEPNKLAKSTRAKLHDLAHRLEHDAPKPWDELNDELFRLYGLDEAMAQVVRDTLFASAFYREEGREAFEPPTRDKVRDPFCAELRDMLEPFFEVCGEHVAVEELPFEQDEWREPWFFLAISRQGETVAVDADLLCTAMAEADRRAASRILVRAPGRKGLLLGLLNQRRWWTLTRARLTGQDILRHHLDAFGLPEDT